MLKRVVIIGGGVWAPRLCEALANALADVPERTQRPALHITLVARRAKRLTPIAAEARRRLAAHPGCSISFSTDRADALQGAHAVVLMARIGGFAARAHDEAFPARWGLVGDEGLGPGGIANAWRTVPWMSELAQDVQRRCPNAWVLNLMAPLGITTKALLDEGIKAVGICELPAVTRAGLGGPPGGTYGGLNHLGWFWNLPGNPGNHALKYFDRVFGGAEPTLGRAAQLAKLSEGLLDAFAAGEQQTTLEAERPTPWFEHATVPALVALLGEQPWRGYANVENVSLLAELPEGHVVEVEAIYDAAGVHAIAPGPLPPEIVPFLKAVAASEALAHRGAISRSKALIFEAIMALPMAIDDPTGRALCTQATAQLLTQTTQSTLELR